jgi:hypothetical protein
MRMRDRAASIQYIDVGDSLPSSLIRRFAHYSIHMLVDVKPLWGPREKRTVSRQHTKRLVNLLQAFL